MWAILGIEPTTDSSAIRRAYAQALRRTNPDDDPVGFANLRQAYELALARARGRGASPVVALAAAPVGAAPASIAPDGAAHAGAASAGAQSAAVADALDSTPSDLTQLRANLAALQKALAAADDPDPRILRALLEACLQSSALENLSQQLEFESVMVHVLLQNQSRIGPLLETVIERWSWRQRGRAADAAIAKLVAQADDIRHLGQVEISLPRTHSALTRKPDEVSLWIQILCYRLDISVREVMAQWRTTSPGVVNAEALAWWRGFFERPHLRPALIRATGLFAVLGALFGLLLGIDHGRPVDHAFTGGVLGTLLGVGVTGLWWGLVDWPRFAFVTRRRAAPRWLQIGWAPAGLAACILASMCPDTVAINVGAIVLSVGLLSWANVMGVDLANQSSVFLLQHVWSVIVSNVAIVIWWILVATAPADAPTGPMWATFAGTLLALAVGQLQLWQEYRSSLSLVNRQLARAAIGLIALAALLFLLYVSIRPEWSRLLLAGLSVIVLVHRTAAANLTVAQIKVRHYVTVGPAIILAQEFNHEQLASTLRLGGLLLMVGVVLSMATCIYNGWRVNEARSAIGTA